MPRVRHVLAFGAVPLTCGCGWFVDLGGLSDGPATVDAATDDAPAADGSGPPLPDAGPDAPTSSRYRAAVLEDGPTSYWPFDDEPGTLVAVDVIGGKNAVVNGKAVFGRAGIVGTGVTLEARESYLEVGNVYDFAGSAPFTIEAWAEPVLDSAFLNIGGKRDGDRFGWVLYFRQEGTAQFEQRWMSGERVGYNETPRAYARPAHVVVTFDGAKLAMYLDNEKFLKVFVPATGSAMTVGASLVWGGGYTGLLDEIAIYDKALSPERVSAHYKAAGR